MELEKAIEKLREIQDRCRYGTYIQNGEREEWKREYQAIEVVLKELEESKDTDIKLYKRLNMQERVIDKMAEFISDIQIYVRQDTYEELMSTFNKKIERESETLEDIHMKCIKEYFYKKVEEQE